MNRSNSKPRKLVLPGTLLGTIKSFKPGTNVYVHKDKIYAYSIGLVDVKNKKINVIPLKGHYIPEVGDLVIGIVIGYSVYSWNVDIRSPYSAVLMAVDALKRPLSRPDANLGRFLNIGDIIVAKVKAFEKIANPLLTIKEKNCGRYDRGTLVEITPTKVPRLIGKKGSLINLIKKSLNVNVVVGKNGRILIIGESKDMELKATEIVRIVEREAHVPGLTDRITNLIKSWGVDVRGS